MSGRGLGAGLRPARPAGRGAPHHAGVRQHAPHGGARGAPAVGTARREAVAAHHGSLAKEQRLDAEQRLKQGELRALVATASLELGIDIGDVDLVCQLGSPRSIASFLQRVGRSGHAVDGTPKGRLFPLSRDDLVECAALLDSVRRGELDRLSIPRAAARRAGAADRGRGRRAGLAGARAVRPAAPRLAVSRRWRARTSPPSCACWPKASATGRGRRGALIHHDAINHMLRGRRGARLTALTSGGTIPDTADYQVLLEPENQTIGTVNEDFAVESLAGDIFQLGNTSYRIMRVERGIVRVEDAHGQPPTIPFWLGEAPGRSDELSASVSRLRARHRQRGCGATGRQPGAALADRRDRHRPRRSAVARISRWARSPRSDACRRRTPSCWSASSTRRAACSW